MASTKPPACHGRADLVRTAAEPAGPRHVHVQRRLHLRHPGGERLLQRREQHLVAGLEQAVVELPLVRQQLAGAARELLQLPVAGREPVRPLQLDDAQVAADREVDDRGRHVHDVGPLVEQRADLPRTQALRRLELRPRRVRRRPAAPRSSAPAGGEAPAPASGRRTAGRGPRRPPARPPPASAGSSSSAGERSPVSGVGVSAGVSVHRSSSSGPVAVTASLGSPTTTVKRARRRPARRG